MIADLIVNAEQYIHAHPGLKEAFEFLRQEKTKQLEPGRYEIDGSRLYALVENGVGRGITGRKLEYHHKYIDIQYVRAGVDVMGWKPLAAFDEEQDDDLTDAQKDRFFPVGSDDIEGVSWAEYPEGSFAAFFPQETHTTMAGQGPIEKVIVKLAVNPQ